MKKSFLALFVVLFSLNFVSAAPVISDVQGTYVHDQSITITGSDFGNKAVAAPWYWEDFEDGTANLNMNSSPGIYDPVINSDDSYAGSQALKCVLGDGNPSSSADRQGYALYNFPHEMVPGEKLFVRFWTKHSWVCLPNWVDAAQIKPWRITAGDPNSPVTPGSIGEPTLTVSLWPRCENVEGFPYVITGYHSIYGDFTNYFSGDFSPDPAVPNSEWVLFEAELTQDTPLLDDGTFKGWISRLGESKLVADHQNVVMRGDASYLGFSKLTLGYWIGNNPPGDITTTIYYDDLYIDNSWARVFMCDSPIYDDCSFREIQVPTSWGLDNIEFTLNEGAFQNGETVYLYVIDENGDISNPYEITIGTSSTPSTEPTVYGVSSNELTDGDTLIINGGAFGSKVPAVPLLFKEFDGPNGETIVSQDPEVSICGGGDMPATFSNDASTVRSPGDSHGRWEFPDPITGSGGEEYTIYCGLDLDAGEKFYYSNFIHSNFPGVDIFGPEIPKQWKMWSIFDGPFCGDGPGVDSSGPSISLNWGSGGSAVGMQRLSIYSDNGIDRGIARHLDDIGQVPNVWFQHELQAQISSGEHLYDGQFKFWYDGLMVWERDDVSMYPHSADQGGDDPAGTPGSVYDCIKLGRYIEHVNMLPAGNLPVIVRNDDVYLDNSWSRVILADTNDWNTNTRREPQPPIAWAGNNIQVTVNTGAFLPGDDAWLYVVDENGNVSEAFGPLSFSGRPPICNNDGVCDEPGEDFNNCPSDCPEDIPKINPYDLTGDEVVDFDDLFELARNYGASTDVNDFSNDGRINILDLLILINNFT